MSTRRVVVSLTGAEAWALLIAARYITEADEPPTFWGMSGHEINALARAQSKLGTGLRRPQPNGRAS